MSISYRGLPRAIGETLRKHPRPTDHETALCACKCGWVYDGTGATKNKTNAYRPHQTGQLMNAVVQWIEENLAAQPTE